MRRRTVRCWMRLLAVMALFAGMCSTAGAATYYVSPDGDDSDGTDWGKAKHTIQGGVDLAVTAGDEVVVSNGHYVLSSEITIGQAITLRSYMEDPSTVLIDGGGTDFCIDMAADATLSGLTITNGYHGAIAGGGIVMTAGTVSNCFILDNVTRRGGGIYMTGGLLVGNTFAANRASLYQGGAILMTAGSVIDCDFIANTAIKRGGAIDATGGIISNCTFLLNVGNTGGGACSVENTPIFTSAFTSNSGAGSSGGAVYAAEAGAVFWDCAFTGNYARSGGAILIAGDGVVDHCTFFSNRVTHYNGGAIHIADGLVTNCSFIGNYAADFGGAIKAVSGLVVSCTFNANWSTLGGGVCDIDDARISTCTFDDNHSSANGGALYLRGTGTVWNCMFTNNVGDHGGAVLMSGDGAIDHCAFVTNVAVGNSDGGAVWMSAGSLRDSEFHFNRAGDDGSAIAVSGGSVTDCRVVDNGKSSATLGAIMISGSGFVSNCVVTGNVAFQGAGVYVSGGALVDCLVASNRSTRPAGGIYQTAGLVDRCTVLHNYTVGNYDGGGVFLNGSGARLRNSLIAGNSARDDGGGVFLNNGVMENCTVVGNVADAGDGVYIGASGLASNTIAYGNDGGDDVYESAANTFVYGCASDVTDGDNGNTTDPPLFVDAGSGTPGLDHVLGDYQLTKPSPCVDAGADADWMLTAVDLAWNPRKAGDHVDMGAYEFTDATPRGTVIIVH